MNTTAQKIARINWIAAQKGGVAHLHSVYKYNRNILPRHERTSRRSMRSLYGLTVNEMNALAAPLGLSPIK